MMQRKSIYAFISCLAISLLLVSQNAAAQRRKVAEVPDTLPFYRGTAVSADLLGAGMRARRGSICAAGISQSSK